MTKMTGDYVKAIMIEKGADVRDAETAAKIADDCWAMTFGDLVNAWQVTSDNVAKMIAEQVLKQRSFEILNAVK